MPEHDAFGRPIGEDPLASLRDATEPAAAPRVEPVEALEPEAAPEPEVATREPEPVAAPRPEFVRPRRRRRGGVVLLLVLAIVVVAAVPAVVGVIATDVRDQVEGVLPNAVRAVPPPVGLERDSMIRRDNFAAALDTLRQADLGRPALLRVAPERVDATLVDGRRMRQVQVRFDGDLQRFSTTETGATPEATTFGRIDPRAPARLVREGARRLGIPTRQIDYLVFSTGTGLPWGAYFTAGGIVQGDARGRLRRTL